MIYRLRVVFCADRQHVFYSAAKNSVEDIRSIIEDMQYPLKHAVSIQLQQNDDELNRWEIVPHWQWHDSPLSPELP